MDLKENKVEDLERVYTDVNSEPIQISYAVVKSITKDFAQVIGHGAFGVVYLVCYECCCIDSLTNCKLS